MVWNYVYSNVVPKKYESSWPDGGAVMNIFVWKAMSLILLV